MSNFPKPLSGKTVLDFSLLLPGPYCTALLAQFGARIIKIEPPGGDPVRKMNANMFAQLNRGKESVVLDLKDPNAGEILKALARMADGLIEGFRPGVMERLGGGYEALSAENPALAYCSLSGFGQDGPYRDRPGHDINFLGLAGYFSVPAQLDGAICRPNVRLADLVAGQTAAMAMAMAMVSAEKTGQGTHLDCSIFDAMASWSLQLMLANKGKLPEDPAAYPHVMGDSAAFETSDGKAITIGTLEDKFWAGLVEAIGEFEPGLRDPKYATRRGRDADKHTLHDLLAKCFVSKTRGEWEAILAPVETAWGPVYQGDEMLADPHLLARNLVSTHDGDGLSAGAYPVSFSGIRGTLEGEMHDLGADTESILREAGWTGD